MRLIDGDELYARLKKRYYMHNMCDWFDRAARAVIKSCMEAVERSETIIISPLPNDPLTLDELREMDLFEWIWVELIHPTKRQTAYEVQSGYYRICEDYTGGEAVCCGWPGLIHEFEYDVYGENWLAYRHKPEEETI